jgi:acetyl-CoA C-acetyltransferase
MSMRVGFGFRQMNALEPVVGWLWQRAQMVKSIQMSAIKNALDDAGLSKHDIDGVVTHSHMLGAVRVHHQRVSEMLGIDTAFGLSISTGGATSPMLIQTAMMAIEAGLCKTVLCVHGDKRATRRESAGMESVDEFGPEYGMFGATAHHALGLTRHMHEYGTTSEQLAWIKVAASHHAQHNPHAMLRDVVTVEDVVNSPMVASPR